MKTLYLTLLISAWSLFGYTAPNAIVVRFNYALLDFSFIDDETKQTAGLTEIFNKRNYAYPLLYPSNKC